MSYYEYPKTASGASLEIKVKELNSYLFRLVDMLNHNADKESPAMYMQKALDYYKADELSGGGITDLAQQGGYDRYMKTFDSLRDLIISNAEKVIAEETEPIVNRFTKEYEAISSEWGAFKSYIQTDITQSADGISIASAKLDQIDSDIDMLRGKAGYINLGWLENENTWGIDIGQLADTFKIEKTVNGEKQTIPFDNFDKFFTRITPTEMRFMVKPIGSEESILASISSTALNFPNAHITGGSINIGVCGQDEHGNDIYNFSVDSNGNVIARSLSLSYTQISDPPNLSVYALNSEFSNYLRKGNEIVPIGSSTIQAGQTGFKVSSAGKLEAANAVIYGTIHAGQGDIGGWTIATNGIEKVEDLGNNASRTLTIGGQNTLIHSNVQTTYKMLGPSGNYIGNDISIVPFLVKKDGSARFNSLQIYGNIKSYGDISFGKENPHIYVDIYPTVNSQDPERCSMLAFTAENENGTGNNLVLGTLKTIQVGGQYVNPFNKVVIRGGENGTLIDGTATISNELYVNYAATFRGDIYASNDIELSGDISVQKGSKIIYRGTNDINIIGTTTMQTENDQGETVTNIKELVVGSSHLTKPIELRTSGGVSIPNCGLSVSGATTLSGALTVSGATTLSSTLTVTGATTLSGGVSGNISLNKDGKIGWMRSRTQTQNGVTTTTNEWWNFIGGKTDSSNNYEYISVGGANVATDILIQNTGSINNIRLSPGGKAYYGSASANNEIATKGDIPSLTNYVTSSSLSTTLSSYLQTSGGNVTGNIIFDNNAGIRSKGSSGSADYWTIGMSGNTLQIGSAQLPGNINFATNSHKVYIDGASTDNEVATVGTIKAMVKASALN